MVVARFQHHHHHHCLAVVEEAELLLVDLTSLLGLAAVVANNKLVIAVARRPTGT